MLTYRNDSSASTILGKGYVYCGHYNLLVCEEFTPDGGMGTWVGRADCPAPGRDALAASTINDKGYIYCGLNGSTFYQECWEYTPNTWTSKTSCPSPGRDFLSASTINNKGYIYGGLNGGTPLNDCDEYDPILNSWVEKTDTPSSLYLTTATTIAS